MYKIDKNKAALLAEVIVHYVDNCLVNCNNLTTEEKELRFRLLCEIANEIEQTFGNISVEKKQFSR